MFPLRHLITSFRLQRAYNVLRTFGFSQTQRRLPLNPDQKFTPFTPKVLLFSWKATSPHMLTKIIFLDVDGVLHPLGPNHLPLTSTLDDLSSRTDEELALLDQPLILQDLFTTRVVEGEFTQKCMSNLKDLCSRNPGALIVLSSTWRTTPYTFRAVERELGKYGLEVFGSTPINPKVGRQGEILEWLAGRGLKAVEGEEGTTTGEEEVKWLALDDEDLEVNLYEGEVLIEGVNFVRTMKGEGLTAAAVEKAVEILTEHN